MERNLVATFDRLSPAYDGLVRLLFGRRLIKSSVALLNSLPVCQRGLIVGGGTGEFLIELALSGHCQTIVYVDSSTEMLARARQRALDAGLDLEKIEFVCAHAQQLPANLRFELICTNYVLDLFTTGALVEVVASLAGLLVPGGLWLFTDLKRRKSIRVRIAYLFFRVLARLEARTLPNYAAAFERAKLTAVLTRSFYGGLIEGRIYKKPGQRI